MVAKSLGYPWIKSYVETVAQSPHRSIPSSFPCPKKRRVQIVKFLTFGSNTNDDCIWAYIADSDCVAIPVKFTQAAIASLAPGDKLIDHLNGLVLIDQYRLVFTRIPREGPQAGMTQSSTLSLEVNAMNIVGDHDPINWRGVNEVSSDVQVWIQDLQAKNANVLRNHNRVQETGPPESSKQAIQRSHDPTPPKKKNKTYFGPANSSIELFSQIEEVGSTKKIPLTSRRLQFLQNVSMPLHVKELLNKIEDDWGADLREGSIIDTGHIPKSAESPRRPHSSSDPARPTTPDEWMATQQGEDDDSEYNPFDGEGQDNSEAASISPPESSPVPEVPPLSIKTEDHSPPLTPASSPIRRLSKETQEERSTIQSPDTIDRHRTNIIRRVPPPPQLSPTRGSLHGPGKVLVENSDISMSQSQSQPWTQARSSLDGVVNHQTNDPVQPSPPTKSLLVHDSPAHNCDSQSDIRNQAISPQGLSQTKVLLRGSMPEDEVRVASQKSVDSTTEDESPILQALLLVNLQGLPNSSSLPNTQDLIPHHDVTSLMSSTLKVSRDGDNSTQHVDVSQQSFHLPYTPATSRHSSTSSESRTKLRPRVSHPRPSLTKSAFLGVQDAPTKTDRSSTSVALEESSLRVHSERRTPAVNEAATSAGRRRTHAQENLGPAMVKKPTAHELLATPFRSNSSSTTWNTTAPSSRKSGPTISSMRESKRHSFIIQTEDGVVKAVDVNAPRLYLGKRARSDSSPMADEEQPTVSNVPPRRQTKVARLDHPPQESNAQPMINVPAATAASAQTQPPANDPSVETPPAGAATAALSQDGFTTAASTSVVQRPRDILRNWRSFLGPSPKSDAELPKLVTWQRLAHVTLQSLRYKNQLAKQ